jgi:hypothetical protein
MRILSIAFCAGLIFQAADATTYYVSSQTGLDTNAGTSEQAPWKSLEKVNASRFLPGDRILLQAGSRWQSALTIPSSGTAAAPIGVDRYGGGPMPRIDAGDVAENAVTIRNVEYVEVRNLELTNRGASAAIRRGVLIAAENIGTLHKIVVSGLYIHDVNGTLEKQDNGGILFRTVGKDVPSRFAGLRIERNIVWRVDRSGIAGWSDQFGLKKVEWVSPWYPSFFVVIRDNYVEDIGGDGIVPWVTYGALVEHNIVARVAQRSAQNSSGIWPWSTDKSLFQLNAVSFAKGTHDGEGFDSDYNSSNTRFVYNLSRENDGGFMLICAPAVGTLGNFIGNTGTVVRKNISWHDHNRTFVLAGSTVHTLIEDNAVYIGKGENVQALITAEWDSWAKDVIFRGNTVAALGTAVYGHATMQNKDGTYALASGWGGARGGNIVFEGNRLLGNHADPPESATTEDASGQAIADLIANEPRFDPANPVDFDSYLTRHRVWMIELFARQYGQPPVFEAPAPIPVSSSAKPK